MIKKSPNNPEKGKENLFSSFFIRYPSWLPALFFLTGLSFAAAPSYSLCIPLFAFSLPVIKKPKYCLFLYTLALSAFFYGKYTSEKFPENLTQMEGVALFYPSEITVQSLHYKKIFRIRGTIHSIDGKVINVPCSIPFPGTPLSFQKYRIAGTLEKKELYFSFTPDTSHWVGEGLPFSLCEMKFQIKNILKKSINNLYTDSSVAHFFTAFTLGDLEDNLLGFAFNRSGLQHILAISGFHFSLLALCLTIFFSLFLQKKSTYIALLGTLSLYFLILNNSPSIMRAYCAITLYLIAKLVGKRPNGLNLLGVTLLIELLIAPQSIKNLGFQLSFLATASILLLFNPCLSLMEKLLPKRSDATVLNFSLLDKGTYLLCACLRSAFAVNLAVSITMIPVSLFHFSSFPLIGLIYNLFIPYTVFIGTALFLLAIPFEVLLPPLASLIRHVNELFTGFILQMLIESPNCLDIRISVDFTNKFVLYLYLLYVFGKAIKIKTIKK